MSDIILVINSKNSMYNYLASFRDNSLLELKPHSFIEGYQGYGGTIASIFTVENCWYLFTKLRRHLPPYCFLHLDLFEKHKRHVIKN